MKVITKLVIIENEKFALVYLEDHKKYGTISYNELNEKGRMKRALNGFEMSCENTIKECLETTRRHILIDKFLKVNNIDFDNVNDLKKYGDFLKQL